MSKRNKTMSEEELKRAIDKIHSDLKSLGDRLENLSNRVVFFETKGLTIKETLDKFTGEVLARLESIQRELIEFKASEKENGKEMDKKIDELEEKMENSGRYTLTTVLSVIAIIMSLSLGVFALIKG